MSRCQCVADGIHIFYFDMETKIDIITWNRHTYFRFVVVLYISERKTEKLIYFKYRIIAFAYHAHTGRHMVTIVQTIL